MSEETGGIIPPPHRERLILILHPKRAAFLVNYVFGFVSFVTGLIFNVTVSGGFVPFTLESWLIGIASLWFGVILVSWMELRRRYTLYVITTWNVRIRTGYVYRKTVRAFYDEITSVKSSIDPDQRAVDLGDVHIFTGDETEPALVFRGLHNPDGIKEIIQRCRDTSEEPFPWSHLARF